MLFAAAPPLAPSPAPLRISPPGLRKSLSAVQYPSGSVRPISQWGALAHRFSTTNPPPTPAPRDFALAAGSHRAGTQVLDRRREYTAPKM